MNRKFISIWQILAIWKLRTSGRTWERIRSSGKRRSKGYNKRKVMLPATWQQIIHSMYSLKSSNGVSKSGAIQCFESLAVPG